MSIIKLKNVSKFYQNKNNISTGFTKINLELNMGEFVVITGESGSGKSTLLNVISGLDSYEEGEMYINGEETSHYTEVDYENYRRKYIGNIFQHFNLVNSYTVYQNIELVLLLNGYKKKEIKGRILEILETVGLSKYRNTKASKLSGGQKQRVAIARAIAKDTPIIVADEPTGNLDVKSAKSIMKLLHDISKVKLVVIVTHNYEQVEEYATRRISMHDGKIIEDKKITDTKPSEAKLVEYHDLKRTNKILLGFRNAFNIKTKFLLLFLVYFFLTILVFSEYSSLQKLSFEESLNGYNSFFEETDPKRVIVNKNDKSNIIEDDINKIKSLDNIDYVVENDTILDINVTMNHDNMYINGTAKSIEEISKVDEGTIDDNSIVLAGSAASIYLSNYKKDLLNSKFTIYSNYGAVKEDIKVSGIIYDEDAENMYSYNYTIYLPNDVLKEINFMMQEQNSNIEISLNNKIYGINDMYFYLKPLDKVPIGEIFAPSQFNYKCSYYDCTNKKADIKISNVYYEQEKSFKISHVLNKDNFKKYTGQTNYEESFATVFMNPTDYDDFFNKGNFQISVFVNDLKDLDDTLDKLESMGYYTYAIKNNLYDPTTEMMGIIKILRTVVFIIATVALIFISYFIIKIILKSRNIYFSTIRILGATKNVAKQLLNIELFIDINMAYFIYLFLIMIVKKGILDISYLKDLVTYFSLKDYIIVYIMLASMSLFISNRYSHKLFKNSVMSTYREEV